MTDTQIAIGVSLVSIAWQALNGWNTARTRSEIADLIERLDLRYVSRERFDVEVKRLEQRIGDYADLRATGASSK